MSVDSLTGLPPIQNPRLLKPSTATQKPDVNILARIEAYFVANTSATAERLSLRWIQLSVPEYPYLEKQETSLIQVCNPFLGSRSRVRIC